MRYSDLPCKLARPIHQAIEDDEYYRVVCSVSQSDQPVRRKPDFNQGANSTTVAASNGRQLMAVVFISSVMRFVSVTRTGWAAVSKPLHLYKQKFVLYNTV